MNEDQITKLILLNVDTGEQLELEYFDEVEQTSFHLFNQGKTIFADPNNSSFFLTYDIFEKEGTKIYHRQQSELTLEYFDICIFNDTLYYCSGSKIISSSLDDLDILKEFNTDSIIFDFEVFARGKFAVIYSSFNSEEKHLDFSNIIIYDFTKPVPKKDLSNMGMRIKSSNSGKYLYFRNGKKHFLYTISSSNIKELRGFERDSINVLGQAYFIDENNLIFIGQKNGENLDSKNLYFYNLETDEISKQIFGNGAIAEIKSTYYSYFVK
jgi:hypothetical protein